MKKPDTDNKLILDVTCGGRTIWYNKNHPHAIYTDIREAPKGCDPMRPNFCVCPDALMDYRNLKFDDNTFSLVVWDPPHLKNLSKKSWFATKYGSLCSETWQEDIRQGFLQCMRVLKPTGILIMKWSSSKEGRPDRDVSLKEMLAVIPQDPLFGHNTGSNSQTYWLCFMKIPETDPPNNGSATIKGDIHAQDQRSNTGALHSVPSEEEGRHVHSQAESGGEGPTGADEGDN